MPNPRASEGEPCRNCGLLYRCRCLGAASGWKITYFHPGRHNEGLPDTEAGRAMEEELRVLLVENWHLGRISVNEARARFGLEPLTGLWGGIPVDDRKTPCEPTCRKHDHGQHTPEGRHGSADDR